MKPTEKQKRLILLIEDQLSFWKNTNDINSPTHFCDIDEDINMYGMNNDDLSEEQSKELNLLLSELLTFIRKNKI